MTRGSESTGATPPMKPAPIRSIALAAINFDATTQARHGTDEATVAEYALAMAAGREFPAVTLFQDGPTRRFWIGDGWHRLLAAQRNGVVGFPATVETGGRAGAIRHALGANAAHGLPRSHADKRHAVGLALREYPNLSDREIAKICAVTHPLVASVRSVELETITSSTVPTSAADASTKRLGADGKMRPATQPARAPIMVPESAPSYASRAARPPEITPAVASAPAPREEATAEPSGTAPSWSHRREVDFIREFIEASLARCPDADRAMFENAINGLVSELCPPPAPHKPEPSEKYGKRTTIPPEPEWVTAYSAEIGYPLNGEKWCDSYSVKGWKVGNARMKDWQAAVRNWKTNGYGQGTVALKGAAKAKPAEDYTL